MTQRSRTGVLFDVDGTLVDTSYLHTVAWWQAFDAHGYRVAMRDIHRCIGQGSDRLVGSLLGHDDDAVRRAHSNFYGPFLEQVAVFPGAAELLQRCHDAGLVVVLASSAGSSELARLRDAIGAGDAVDAATSKDDVETSKPAPDIVAAALAAGGLAPADAVLVGDTGWDVAAAARAGVACVGVCTGGWSEADLRAAGAAEVYPDVRALLAEFDTSLLTRRRAAAPSG